MKILTILLSASILTLFSACKNGKENENAIKSDSTTISASNAEEKSVTNDGTTFDVSALPISNVELGAFPFFSVPAKLKYQNTPLKKDYDEVYFPLGKDGKFEKIGGKTFKSYIVKADNSDSDWSLAYFLKSYEEAIKSIGGVKVFSGKISDEQYDYLKKNALYLGEEGSIEYNETLEVYVIRRPNGDDIYFQFSGNTASGAIQIVQKQAFKQTISMLKAADISKDLNEKGKAVLHINFDTDKATLKPDGITAVAEITNALNADKSLKIVINGFTDNAGTESHNLTLSRQRAETVKNELIKAGISASRLSSNGYGQNNPIMDNGTEDGKAQNRRVELIKI